MFDTITRPADSGDLLRKLNVEPIFVRPEVGAQLLGLSIDKYRMMMAAGELPQEHCFGRAVAHRLFEQRAGEWEVCVLAGNDAAEAFWREAIGSCVSIRALRPVAPLPERWQAAFRFRAGAVFGSVSPTPDYGL